LKRPTLKVGEKLVVAASKSHFNEETKAFMAALDNIEIHKVGGCGNKFLHILEGLEDCLLYVGAGTSRWDTCAGDALIECLGGNSTEVSG